MRWRGRAVLEQLGAGRRVERFWTALEGMGREGVGDVTIGSDGDL